MYVALDNTLVISEVKDTATNNDDNTKSEEDCDYDKSNCDKTSQGWWRPLLLFIPLRLGLTEINPVYLRGLKACFTVRQTLGVIGGRPNHALYMMGYVGDEVIYLDPHVTQVATN